MRLLETRGGGGGGGRFEADVPGAADPAAGAIRFTTPPLDVAPATLAVAVSLDGGRTFSGPCPRRLAVRRRPVPCAVAPGWACAAGGTRVVVSGEHLRPEPPGGAVWIRFECAGIVKRARAEPAGGGVGGGGFSEMDESDLDDPDYFTGGGAGAAGGDAGEAWACVLPRMIECAPSAHGGGAGIPAAVTISLDGGATWLPPQQRRPAGADPGAGGVVLALILHAPLELQPARPCRIWCGGGAELAVGGAGLFRTPCTALRVVPVDGSSALAVPVDPGPAGAVTAARAAGPCGSGPICARLSSRPALAAVTPALDFVGDAVVEVWPPATPVVICVKCQVGDCASANEIPQLDSAIEAHLPWWRSGPRPVDPVPRPALRSARPVPGATVGARRACPSLHSFPHPLPSPHAPTASPVASPSDLSGPSS